MGNAEEDAEARGVRKLYHQPAGRSTRCQRRYSVQHQTRADFRLEMHGGFSRAIPPTCSAVLALRTNSQGFFNRTWKKMSEGKQHGKKA